MRAATTQSGFTLIELLVVIAIIGILTTVISLNVSSARVKSRDAKRVGDIRQLITALEQYYIARGVYPTGTASVVTAGNGTLLSGPGAMDTSPESFTPTYVPFLPVAPKPADGTCSTNPGIGGNNYWYGVADDGSTYTLTFCLGKGFQGLNAGQHSATPNGLN